MIPTRSSALIHENEPLRFPRLRFGYGVAFALLLLLMGWPSRAAAQVSAAISGVVTDATGATVSAAMVTAKDVETSAARTTVTDAAGRYELLELAVGEYEVTVTKDAFQ